MNSLLRAEHLTVCYDGVPVVQDVSFQLNEGEILGIVGESGSGKSTVIRAVMGLLGNSGTITGGKIWYRDQCLTDMSERDLMKYRGAEIGMVFQDCGAGFCPVRTVGAQIYEAVSAHEKTNRVQVEKRAEVLMEKIGLKNPRRVLKSYPFQLSGGMNQRVGICAAMMLRPAVLLADEPTSALDVTVQKQVAEELLLMREEFHTSMILVTHNMGLVKKMTDRVLVLCNGQMMDYGKTEEVLQHPESAYTQELMDSVVRLKRKQI